MADVTMPQLGESVTEGTITQWFKNVGDQIAEDEPLFEVSTDKVDSEVPSPLSGTVTEILAAEGDTVEVGDVIAVVSDSAPEGGGESADEPVAGLDPRVDADLRRGAEARAAQEAEDVRVQPLDVLDGQLRSHRGTDLHADRVRDPPKLFDVGAVDGGGGFAEAHGGSVRRPDERGEGGVVLLGEVVGPRHAEAEVAEEAVFEPVDPPVHVEVLPRLPRTADDGRLADVHDGRRRLFHGARTPHPVVRRRRHGRVAVRHVLPRFVSR